MSYIPARSVKESGYVSKHNPIGKLSLESIKWFLVQSTGPVHQSSPLSSPVIVDYHNNDTPTDQYYL